MPFICAAKPAEVAGLRIAAEDGELVEAAALVDVRRLDVELHIGADTLVPVVDDHSSG